MGPTKVGDEKQVVTILHPTPSTNVGESNSLFPDRMTHTRCLCAKKILVAVCNTLNGGNGTITHSLQHIEEPLHVMVLGSLSHNMSWRHPKSRTSYQTIG